jgi:hypothetical protein
LFLKTDGAGNLSFSSDLPTTSFTGATVETSIAGGDLVLVYDDSATAVRKMTRTNFVAGIGASAGQVIQVVQASNSTQTDTTSSTFSDIVTGSITPSSASNTILVVAHANGLYSSTLGAFGSVRISHSTGTTSVSGTVPHIGTGGGDVGVGSASISYLDSPATTSSVTYKIQFNCPYTPSGAVRINVGSSMSTLTLMEIKG